MRTNVLDSLETWRLGIVRARDVTSDVTRVSAGDWATSIAATARPMPLIALGGAVSAFKTHRDTRATNGRGNRPRRHHPPQRA
jgi:hypothetical protein